MAERAVGGALLAQGGRGEEATGGRGLPQDGLQLADGPGKTGRAVRKSSKGPLELIGSKPLKLIGLGAVDPGHLNLNGLGPSKLIGSADV